MAFINIDPSLDIAEEIADLLMTFISDSVEFNRNLTVYEILAQKIRPGLNSEILANSIV